MIRLLTTAFVLVVAADAALAQNLNAQFQLTVTPPTLPLINTVTLSAASFSVPISSGATIATISTTCKTSAGQATSCPGTPTYAMATSGSCAGSASAQNGSFTPSGTNLNTTTALSTAQQYNIGIAATMTGVSNSGTCFPFQLQGTTTPPTLTVNGSTGPLSVAANSTMTVVAAGGPGLNGDYLRVCQNYVCGGPPSSFPNTALDWAYLDCTKTSSGLTLTGGTCNLTAPAGPANPTTVELETSVSPFNIAVVSVTITGGTTPSITGVSLSSSTFTVPFSGTVATISTACNTTCPSSASYSLPTAATAGCTSAQIAQNSNFAISGNDQLVTNGTLSTAQTYNVGIVVSMGNVTNSGQCWPQTITGTSVGAGCLSGSICPPGTWVNDFDEHFTGTTLNGSNWSQFINGAQASGGFSYCSDAGVLTVNNGLTIKALPWNYKSSGGSSGCTIQSINFSTPGYFEAYMKGDTGSNTWGGVFFIVGPMADCGGDMAHNGGEVDLNESFGSSAPKQNVWIDGYGSCVQTININTTGPLASNDAFHVWGMDFGDSGAVTLYRDGVQTGVYAPSGGVGTWTGHFYLWNQSCAPSSPCTVTSNGQLYTWVRHYHH